MAKSKEELDDDLKDRIDANDSFQNQVLILLIQINRELKKIKLRQLSLENK